MQWTYGVIPQSKYMDDEEKWRMYDMKEANGE